MSTVGCGRSPRFVVGSKPFTESEILGEMIAQLAEAEGLPVERKFYIGPAICFDSLRTGAMDAYVEYTGTGLVNILKEPAEPDPAKVLERVRSEFQQRWGLVWLDPLGFENSYAIVVRSSDAKRQGWTSISALRPKPQSLRCGFDLEFADRPDGYAGLKRRYGFDPCRGVRQMSPDLMYEALAKGEVDAISGYSTDGRIATLGLTALRDDLRFFPPYQAVPLLSAAAVRRSPALVRQLRALAGRIDDATMTRLNADVDTQRMSAHDAARAFLLSQRLLAK